MEEPMHYFLTFIRYFEDKSQTNSRTQNVMVRRFQWANLFGIPILTFGSKNLNDVVACNFVSFAKKNSN